MHTPHTAIDMIVWLNLKWLLKHHVKAIVFNEVDANMWQHVGLLRVLDISFTSYLMPTAYASLGKLQKTGEPHDAHIYAYAETSIIDTK